MPVFSSGEWMEASARSARPSLRSGGERMRSPAHIGSSLSQPGDWLIGMSARSGSCPAQRGVRVSRGAPMTARRQPPSSVPTTSGSGSSSPAPSVAVMLAGCACGATSRRSRCVLPTHAHSWTSSPPSTPTGLEGGAVGDR